MNVGLKFCFVDVVQKSFHVGQSCQFGITPQLFEIIIFPRFGLEDMYIDMTVIDNNPLRVFVSVVVKRFYTDFLQCRFSYRVGDSCYLCRRSSLTNDKILSRRRLYFREVCGNDLFTFLFLYSFDDGLYQILVFFHVYFYANSLYAKINRISI